FQAEDGIRDGHVTGVQTCALPIYLHLAESDRPGAAFVSLPIDVMTSAAKCKSIRLSTPVAQGPAAKHSLSEAARLIDSAKSPVILLGLMASKPKFSAAIRNLLSTTTFPVVGTFQA